MAIQSYDAIVVGSGATGGVAAMELTRQGLSVLVLEAGPELKGPSSYGTQGINLARQLKQRWLTGNQSTQEWHGGYWETNPDLFVDDRQNPYTTPADKPYKWIRGRQVGGRSHTWGGVTLRFSDYEFKAASADGIGDDWPISHADLAPHYDRLEGFFRSFGHRDGLEQLPDGNFVGQGRLSPGEEVFKRSVEKNFSGRKLIHSRGIHAKRAAEKGDQFSKLSSPATSLAAAQATGRLTLRADAVVSRILTDEVTGRATGVEYLHRRTREHHAAHARIVFLCASTLESLRIMMMSKSPQHPDGIGAQSGLLGKGIMDHIVSNVYFHLPEVPDAEGYELLGSDSAIIPRYHNLGKSTAPFARGFGFWGGIQRLRFPELLLKRRGTAFGFFCAMGESIPDNSNFMTLDPVVRDAWGLPVAHISAEWKPNDLLLAKTMRQELEEMVRTAGGQVTTLPDTVHTPFITGFMTDLQKQWELTVPGLFVHEVGGARMGLKPQTSVLNSTCQSWECPNVFVTDGACFVSSGWQNPTLTEMAITSRAASHAVREAQAGNL